MRQANAERELIGRMQAGDSAAVAELSSTYGPRIHQLAFRYLKNWEDAEEVAQDVLMKVHRKIGAFRGDAALSSWIYRITFNTAMSRLRTGRFSRPHEVQRGRRGRRESASAPPQEPADWSSLADDQVLRGQMRDAPDRGADAPAGGLSHAGDPARHPGTVDRRSQRHPEGEAADAEVAPASRPADPARTPGRLRGRVTLHERETLN